MTPPSTHRFGLALKSLRRARGLSQETFDQVSSRTYISALERGMKQPTIAKVAELAAVLDVHPIVLLALSFSNAKPPEAAALLRMAAAELDGLRVEG